ncbi:response regulator [uncultured Cohaesibacter sp.]|uniref:response regulator n=1 Tax=uncultured Cohaesibacter sp. TaxID=1002546 RepID=UPI002AAB8281|nr:response regulator [uncultured Cohaesibacter sp.]
MISPKKVQQEPHVLHKMLRVLVADDSAVTRDVIRRGILAFKNDHYLDVTFVADGAEALKVLKSKKIDVAFIDIHMPGLTGPQLVSELPNTVSKECLTIAISGRMDEKSEAVLKEFGAYHFMQKPFKAQDAADVFMTYIVMTQTYRILVVDDSATMRKLTKKILGKSRFGFDVIEADSARTALQAIVAERPNIILTDFHMPDVDGLELAGMIRSVSERIGIYMMSTSDTDHLERSAAFVGITGFLKKPFTAADIDSIMHKRLDLDTPKFGKTRPMFTFLERPVNSNQVFI